MGPLRRLAVLVVLVVLLVPAPGLRVQAYPVEGVPGQLQGHPGDVVFSEIGWAGTDASSSDEWIELYNTTAAAVDLVGWTLQAQDGSPSIALSGTIPPFGYYLLERTDDDTISDIPADWVGSFGTGLSNSGEVLELRDDQNMLIDTANAEGGGAWPAGTASPNYQSMERLDPWGADLDSNWASNDMSLRNGHDAGGAPINGTPKLRNSASAPAADLFVTKAGPAQVVVGEDVHYTLLLGNLGNLDAALAVLTDTLPAGVSFVDQASPYPFSQPDPQTLAWDLGTLPYSLTAWAILVSGTIAPTASGILTNLVYGSTAVTEVTTANNAASVQTLVQLRYPDLGVDKGGPPAVEPGDLLTYTLSLQNIGQWPAPGVRLTDTLPAQVVFLGQSSPYTWTQPAPDTLVWELGVLPTDTLATILVYGQVLTSAIGTLTNTVHASTAYTETALDNNRADWATQVTLPGEGQVVINEVAWAGTAASSSDEWIELHNTSANPVDLAGWTLSDGGDVNIALAGVITAGGYFLLERTADDTVSDIPADQIYSGNLGNTGEALTLSNALGQAIDTANADGGTWPAGTSDAGLRSMERVDPLRPGDDGNWAHNDMVHRNGLDANGFPLNGTPRALNSASYPPPPAADLVAAKSGPLTVFQGAPISYTLALSNVGTVSAPAVRLTDTLPAAVRFVGQGSPYTFTRPAPGLLVWDLGALAVSGTAAILVQGEVLSTAAGSFSNTVVAGTPFTETNLENNRAAWTTTVIFPSSGRVVINEVAWAGTAASTSDEWIELYNASPYPVDLAGWTLIDGGDLTLTLAGVIPAGGYSLLERGDDNTVSDIPADWVGSFGSGLSNAGESLLLRDATGATVDTANGNGGEWPAGSSAPDYASMERIDPLSPDGDGNWASNDLVHRNGLDANGGPLNGTPKALNSPAVAADLSVSKSGPLTAAPGAVFEYVLAISNVGVLPAEDVRLTDTLPLYAAFLAQESDSSFVFEQVSSRELVWTAPSLPTGTVAVITLSVRVQDAAIGVLNNLLRATTASSETIVSNNTATWRTELEGAGSRVYMPLLFKNYWHDVKINAVLYNGYQHLDRDEAVQLINLGTGVAPLDGWELCKYDTQGGLSCRDLPPDLLGSQESIWLARSAISFTVSFGFPPDYELDPWLTRGLSDDGDEVILRDPQGRVVDALIYGNSPYTTSAGWSGPALDPYYDAAGQVMHRAMDERSGQPVPDTDAASDWWQYPDDPGRGRRALYAGWDMESFFWPLSVTEAASLTVAIAPDHAAEVMLDAIERAQSTIEAELYELTHYGLVQALVGQAQRGVTVTVLLEGGPAGGLSEQEKWACGQLEGAGGQCWFMFNGQSFGENIYDRYDYLHSKMVLIDRQWVVISSQNLTAGGMPDDDKSDGTWGSRGVLLLTDAPSVVARAAAIFEADWDPLHHNDLTRWAVDNPYGFGPPEPGFEPIQSSGGTSSTVHFPQPLDVYGLFGFELLSAPEAALRQQDALLGLLSRAGAGDVVHVEQMYEHSSWGALPDGIPAPNLRLEAYIEAARRGAQVRILLNAGSFGQEFTDLDKNVETLVYVNSVAICEGLDLQALLVDPTAYGIHNKMVLVRLAGQGYAHIGSINGSETSNKTNRELAVQVRSNEVYDYLDGVFEVDWAAAAPLFISEALYDPTGPEPGSEWVEIYNPSPLAVDLSGWSVGDALIWGEYGSGRYSFPGGTSIPAHDVLLVAAQAAHFQSVYGFWPDYELNLNPIWDDPTVPNLAPMGAWEGFGFALGNDGDEVGIWNASGEVVDVLVYCNGSACEGIGYSGVQPYWDYVPDDYSLERRPPDLDTGNCSAEFYANELPTPGGWPDGYPACGGHR